MSRMKLLLDVVEDMRSLADRVSSFSRRDTFRHCTMPPSWGSLDTLIFKFAAQGHHAGGGPGCAGGAKPRWVHRPGAGTSMRTSGSAHSSLAWVSCSSTNST